MIRKLIIPALALVLAAHVTGCTSGDANKENGDVAASSDESFPEEGEADFKKDDGASGDKTADAQPKADGAADSGLGDEPLDGSGTADASAKDKGGDLALDAGDPDHEFPDDVAKSQKDGLAQNAPSDDKVFGDQAAPPPPPVADNGQPPPTDAAPPPADPGFTPAPDSGAQAAAPADSEKPKPVVVAPYEKMKDAPFERNGTLLNRVYLARSGDTVKGISDKIYGSNRSKDLKAWNPMLKSRAPRTGDKIYYSSPKDPNDSKMIVYYEEAGVPPQTYTTKDGDNIRKVSTQLLGNKDSWKEIYATNATLDTKQGTVPAGVELRFWPDAGAAGTLADAGKPTDTSLGGPPDEPLGGLPPDDPLAANPPPPNPGGKSPSSTPPPPMGAMGNAGGNVPPPPPTQAMNNLPPPPPPPIATPVQAAPPPPPPPPIAEKPVPKKAPPVDTAGSDPDTTMALAAGAVVLLGLVAAVIVIRRNRAKRIDLSQTQV